jgi:hypothetical protein
MCAQLGTPLDVFAYQIFRSGMHHLLQEVSRREQELEQQAVQEPAAGESNDVVYVDGDTRDTNQESGSTGVTTEVPMEPKNYSVENV